MSRPQSPHRTWDSAVGVTANLIVTVFVLGVTILNLAEGAWGWAALGVVVIVGFGIAPAVRAHKAGALWLPGRRPQ